VSQPYETLELRLTDEQIAAIRQRIARRKRQIADCSEVNLGEINGTEDLKSSNSEKMIANIAQATYREASANSIRSISTELSVGTGKQ
jgi:hypothetical protein